MSIVTNQIAYLAGGESPTAACMNKLFMAMDRKLGKLLSGKSPVIAQSANFPAFLLGKTFFFTHGQPTVYCSQVPGCVGLNGGTPMVVRDYVHAQFTSAVAALDPTQIVWDETNRTANVPKFPFITTASGTGAYVYYPAYPNDPGIPCSASLTAEAYRVGFLENSLQCHYLMHQGASDTTPVPYYIWETHSSSAAGDPTQVKFSNAKMPEKRYDWAVAELILEGQTALTIPAAWDKYKFFRIHNLNPANATVTFQMDASATPKTFVVTVPAFGCQTVRRSSVAGGYALNGNYFWWAVSGDPRFYWFQPCGYGLANQTTNRFAWAWDGRVADTMMQNNLTNPVGLLDWIEYFTRDVDDFPGINNYWATASIHAGFIKDLSEFHSEYGHYSSLYGDPGNPATCLGDLIHHKGTVYAVQASKTQTDAISGKPFLKVIKGAFNGYATFVADMAALGVTASLNASGDYQLTNANPTQYDVVLVPVGTNFLKRGDTVPDHVVLAGPPESATGTYTIENLVLEQDPTNSESALSATTNQMVWPATFSSAANTRQWINYYSMHSAATVVGPNIPTISTANRSGTPVALHGIHAVTVADLLSLKFWAIRHSLRRATRIFRLRMPSCDSLQRDWC